MTHASRTFRIAASLSLILALAPATIAAQTVFAVVLGNQKYVVGSSTLHSGLFRSRDDGRSWEHLGPENLKAFSMDAVDTAAGRILYIAAGNGVHRSLDGGRSWRIVTDWRMTEVLDVRVDQGDPRWIYAATATGFWRSSDAGESWTRPEGALATRYVYRINELEWPGGIYASSDSAVYESIDYGTTWSVAIRVPAPRGIFHIGGASAMIASGRGPLFLDPTMSAVAAGGDAPPMNCYDIAFASHGGIAAAGDHGVWAFGSSAGFRRWENMTEGLPTRNVHALAITPESGTLLAGTFGEGIHRWESGRWVPSGLDGSQVWRLVTRPW